MVGLDLLGELSTGCGIGHVQPGGLDPGTQTVGDRRRAVPVEIRHDDPPARVREPCREDDADATGTAGDDDRTPVVGPCHGDSRVAPGPARAYAPSPRGPPSDASSLAAMPS